MVEGVPFEPARTYSLRLWAAIRKMVGEHSQRAVAAELRVSESRVSQMMRGGENWTIESVQRLLLACERLRERAAVEDLPSV